MSAYAAVMTGQAVGAISSIQVFGESAQDVLNTVFKRANDRQADFRQGAIYLGTIQDEGKIIDQVTIGCEGENCFAINCHGNPLIVEMIMQVLVKNGVTLLASEELTYKILTAGNNLTAIAIEAKAALPRAKTLAGSKIIANQVEGGLNKVAKEWLEKIDTISIEQMQVLAGQILRASATAKLIMFGCKAVLAGPANSGKSTLFNCICGKNKAIVSAIKGTTRDWISAQCQIGQLMVEFIDTAGIEGEAGGGTIEKAAQEASLKSLREADLVLLIQDGSEEAAAQFDERLLAAIEGNRILPILNKSDLSGRKIGGKNDEKMEKSVKISAKFAKNIEIVTEKIEEICGVSDFDLSQPVCVTQRQEKLLRKLAETSSREQASTIVGELVAGSVPRRAYRKESRA